MVFISFHAAAKLKMAKLCPLNQGFTVFGFGKTAKM
jgi:hypothetical protein